MEKLKIAITQGNYDAATQELSGKIIEDPAMLELCTPVVYKAGQEEAALRDLDAGKVDALVLAPTDGHYCATALLPLEVAYACARSVSSEQPRWLTAGIA